MERINMNGNENPNGNKRPGNDVTKSKACPDIYRDLTSQVQMMSDSLAACRQLSKYRPVRKKQDILKAETCKEPTIQILLPPGEKSQSPNEEKDVIVSYMMKGNEKPDFLQKSRYDSLEKISGRSDDELESSHSQKLNSQSSSLEDVHSFEKTNSKPPVKVDTDQLIEILQKELKILLDLAPPVAVLVAALSDTLFHYKGCSRCRGKVSSSLPWILNRIRKLIKYVTVKRRGTFCWPTDYEFLQFEVVEQQPAVKEPEELVEPEPVEPPRQIGKLERVDAVAVSEDRPGVQICLEVKSEKKRKRFFDQADRKYLGTPRENFPAVELREPASALVVEVLKPSRKPKILWASKREVWCPKQKSISVRLESVFPSKLQSRFFVLLPVGRIRKPVDFLDERKKSFITVFLPRNEETNSLLGDLPRFSDERRQFTSRDFLANAPEVVKDLLKEAEEERMQIHKVKELELEVKSLKNLMLDVHKNQMELSKVLLEKGVYSQPIIKLTDPNMLEEESRAVKKAAEIETPGPKSFPVETLQTTVCDLKRKCMLKNRMIMTLLKGLRSDVPKEWWEEIINSTFDETKPIEDFDSEKVSQFIRHASIFLTNGEKASRVPFPASRTEELPSEVKFDSAEERIVKGNVGVENQRTFAFQQKDAVWLSDCDDHPRRRILKCPAIEVPEKMKKSMELIENQVSVLNVENERLWHEVHDLRNLLHASVKELHEKGISRATSDRQLSDTIQTQSSGKAINLTIKIASEKDFRRGSLKISKAGHETNFSGISKSSPIVRCTSDDLSASEKNFPNPKIPQQQSNNDLTHLNDDNQQNVEKLKLLLHERAFGSALTFPPTSNPWFPSDVSQPGPSHRRIDVDSLLQSPSLNIRDLQPILENDTATADAKSISQTIQRLRTRIRSIHKDVTVLKSKNDRIDKLLDRLLDDTIDNKTYYKEVESDLNNFKTQFS